MDLGNILKDAAASVGASDMLAKAAAALGIDAEKLAMLETLKTKYTELMADGKLSKEEVMAEIETLAKTQGIDTESGIIGKVFDMLDGKDETPTV
jgi:hypothetical protein